MLGTLEILQKLGSLNRGGGFSVRISSIQKAWKSCQNDSNIVRVTFKTTATDSMIVVGLGPSHFHPIEVKVSKIKNKKFSCMNQFPHRKLGGMK